MEKVKNMEKYTDEQFRNASYFREPKIQKIIRNQPGYRRGNLMTIRKAKTGGYRLYALIGNQWMDGSLQDMAVDHV